VQEGNSHRSGILQVEYGNLIEGPCWQEKVTVEIPEEKPILATRFSLDELPIENTCDEYLAAGIWIQNRQVARSEFFPASLRMANLPNTQLSFDIDYKEGNKVRLFVASNAFAYTVRLRCYGAIFTDNYFNLLPEESRLIDVDLSNAQSNYISCSALNADQTLFVEV
jgi:hypothetical protein